MWRQPSDESGGSAKALRVLVVDDEPEMRDWLRDALESAGYEIIEATNGRKAADLLRREKFDLCITDLAMPEQEGIETIRMFRRWDPAIRIIAISGAFDSVILRTTKMLGAAATLQKPIRLEKLLETVNLVLQGS